MMPPARRWNASVTVAALLASMTGMALGFLIDSRSMGPGLFASLCRAAPVTFAASVAYHCALLKMSLLGMMLAGIATSGGADLLRHIARNDRLTTLCARLGIDLVCGLTMLAGMLLGGWIGPLIAAELGAAWGPATMLAAMAAGMSLGFVAHLVPVQILGGRE